METNPHLSEPTLSEPIFFSHSGVSGDWRCQRSRMWGSEWGGTGLEGEGTSIYLFLGTTLHDGLAAIAHGVDIDSLADAAHDQVVEALTPANPPYPLTPAEVAYAHEQAALTEGLLRGFYRSVWPTFAKNYTVRYVEREVIYIYDNLVFMAKPDLIVEDRDGLLWYVEYKSTGWNNDKWTNSWTTAAQLHSSIIAANQTLGVEIEGVIVQGLFKGSAYKGKQSSPFCYAYHKAGDPPFTEDKVSYTYKPGYYKYPAWELPGGVKRWVASMPQDLLAEQFPQVPHITLNKSLAEAYFAQRADRENEIRMGRLALENPENPPSVREMVLNQTFPQRFDQCNSSFGSPCTFRKLCHSTMGNDPLRAGFVPRSTAHREPYFTLHTERTT